MIKTKPKVRFDVNNKQHLQAARQFLATNKWGTTGCPFELEYPYLSTPDMIKDKLVRKYLKVEAV